MITKQYYIDCRYYEQGKHEFEVRGWQRQDAKKQFDFDLRLPPGTIPDRTIRQKEIEPSWDRYLLCPSLKDGVIFRTFDGWEETVPVDADIVNEYIRVSAGLGNYTGRLARRVGIDEYHWLWIYQIV